MIGRGDEGTEVFDVRAEGLAGAGKRFAFAHEVLLQAFARARVERVEQLVEVSGAFAGAGGQRRTGGQRRRVVGAREKRHIAPRDSRQRWHPHLRGRAPMQRHQRAFDVDRDQRGAVVVGERDTGDVPHRHATNLHLIAEHELAVVFQFELVGGPAAAGEHDVDERRDHHHKCADRQPATHAPRRWGDRPRRSPTGPARRRQRRPYRSPPSRGGGVVVAILIHRPWGPGSRPRRACWRRSARGSRPAARSTAATGWG